MKKQLFVILAGILLTVGIANADTIQSLPQWILYGNTLKPVVTSSTVQIPSLGSSGNPCVNVNASGTLATSTCGSGGGSGSLASTTPWTVGNLVAVSSGQYLASISSGTYYLATNPNGFTTTTIQSVLNSLSAVSPITINTSTGVIGWTNSNNYITLASLSGLSPISYNSSTGAFSCPTCITVVPTSTITINGISTSSFNFLATGTGLSVSSSSNNITYNWTNPGYITTSTFNATGTPYYVPLWNASGTALTPTSSIFVSSTGNVGIGTTTPTSLFTIASTTMPLFGVSSGGIATLYDTAGGAKNTTLSSAAGYGNQTTLSVNGGIQTGGIIATYNGGGFRAWGGTANLCGWSLGYDGGNDFNVGLMGSASAIYSPNLGIGTTTPTGLLHVVQGIYGVGTITTAISSTAVTGTNTTFLNTFRVGDTITANGETHTIATITDNTHITTNAWTNANTNVAYTLTGGTRFIVQGNGNVGIGTTTPNSTLQINGNVAFTSSSTIVTASLGGSALLAGACSSVTSTIDSTVTSSTAAFVTTPQNYPGVGAYWSSYLSAPSVLTTQVCEPVAATPTATAYNIKNY